MIRIVKTLTVAAALGLGVVTAALPVASAYAAPAASLEGLLDRVRQGRVEDNSANKKREAEFKAQRDQQARLLREAKAAVAREERTSEQLEAQFQNNEQELASLTTVLEERQGAFGELFGVVRQVAGDTRGQLGQSLISAQYPGREKAIDDLAQTKKLPEMSELKNLWYTLMEEAVRQGEVVRFQADVAIQEGDRVTKDVVRIGPFTAITDSGFLSFNTDTGILTELPRQPAGQYVSAGEELYNAPAGSITETTIDPSRGTLLELLVGTPSLRERIDQGGLVGYVIIVLLVIGVLLAAERIVTLSLISGKVSSQKKSSTPSEDNPLGRVMATYNANRSLSAENMQLKLDDAILKELPKLERGLTTIKVLAAISPMLGLLGTVTGMIQTFQAITLFGTGDPKMMAGGISQALITTVLGLVSAIPLILLHSIAAGRSRAVVEVLEEQSAGLMAAHAEK